MCPNNHPKISIITVCKNSAATIENTIQSVIAQNYPNLEYIIVDGQSCDKTLDIVNKYTPHINTIVSEKDDGIYDAMNKGIQLATGDIIGLLNSDDQYMPETLAIVAQHYNPKNIVTGYCVRPNNSKSIPAKKRKRFQKKKPLSKMKYVMALDHSATFVPLNLYKIIGPYDDNLRIAADYKWTAKAWSQGIEFTRIDQPLTVFAGGGLSDTNRIRASLENRKVQIELKLLPVYMANLYLVYRIILRFTPKSFMSFIQSILKP